VSQVSAPIRIALVAVLAIVALWFVALRPKPVEEAAAPPSAAPAATGGLGGAVDKAHDAAATSDAANAAIQQATGGQPAAESSSTPAGEPAAAAPSSSSEPSSKAASKRDYAAPLLRDLGKDRAVVLLFVAKGADDRAAKAAVRSLDRRGGRVRVKIAAIGDVAKYEQVTTGVQVVQAPTTLVIGPDRTAKAITGYTDVAEVEQAVGDALAR
jgi:hypothetical protein